MPPITTKKLKLEIGMYQEAAAKNIGMSQWLEDHYAEKAQEDSIYLGMSMHEQEMKKIELRKAGKEVPPTAFEKLLMAHDIKAFGAGSDFVEKFYSTAETAVLFPNFIANRIYAGLLLTSLVPQFVATTEILKGLNYQKLYMAEVEVDRQLREVGQGVEFPAVEISVSDQVVAVKKFGRYLQASYEAMQFQRLNAFGLMMQRIGVQIGIDETDEMFYVHINGDGNSNTPGTTVTTAASGTIAVQDVIAWATGAPSPYKTDKFVGKKALLQEYLATIAGMNYPVDPTGKVAGISLPQWFEWDRTIITADRFFGVDSRFGLGHVTTGQPMIEYEKIIRKQLTGAAISQRSGFHVIDANANTIFDETH